MSELDEDLDPPFSSNARSEAILTTDASAEGEACATALRAHGYHVVDVPLSLLEARAIGEAPRVIVVDVDQPGAIDAVERLRELAAGSAAQLVCIGGRAKAAELGFEGDSDRVFERPVDRDRFVAVISELADPPSRDPRVRGTTPPPSYAPRRDTAAPPFRPSDVPAASEMPLTSDPLDVEALLAAGEGTALPTRLAPMAMSPELTRLLKDAEDRVSIDAPHSGTMTDDAIDLLLSPELLAALDEPLDPEENEPGTGSSGVGTPLGARPPTTSAGRPHTTGAAGIGTSPGALQTGSGSVTTYARTNVGEPRDFAFERTPLPPPAPERGTSSAASERTPVPSFAHARTPAPMPARPVQASPPAASVRGRDDPPPTEFEPLRALSMSKPTRAMDFGETSDTPPPSRAAGPSTRSSGALSAPREGGATWEAPIPAVLGEGDALRAFARTISRHASGSLAMGTQHAMRRVVLRDGDVVTAASGAPDETLLAFLVARGDLERDAAASLAGKLPPFGRHAGAALIAHGHLGQEDLWPVLRAHAEWILARAVASDEGTCELEVEPPGRLKAEPNVFGGATGAEVLVETARRTFTPEVALERIGGVRARLEAGPRASLLAECALRPEEEELVRAAAGRTVGEILAQSEPVLANVLYVLGELGVLDVSAPRSEPALERGASADPLDEEALRKRVRARVALAHEGDYFSLLGVPRGATGYEVRRAYLELRRSFEPARVLTAATADLAADVRLVVEVLEEAYDILREPARRERYRRAIEAGPP